MNRFRTVAVTAITGLVLVACSSGASATPTPTLVPSHAAQSSGGPQPSFSAGVVADLEALIPGTIGTVTMTKSSMRGNEFLVAQNSDPATVKFIKDLGVSPSDISMALGFGFTGDASAVMFVIRAAGADSARLAAAFKTATAANGGSPPQWSDATVSGKHVQTASQGTAGTIYLYAKNDFIVYLTATDPAAAQKVIGGLP